MVVDVIDFSQEVLARSYSIPVLVDFWASWCKACSILSPVLELLAQRHRGEWTLVKLNVEEHPDLAVAYGVTGIPNVKLFVDGKVVNEFSGVVPGHAIEEWLRESLPRKTETGVEQARRLLAQGDDGAAEAILQSTLNENPGQLEAKVLLARAVFRRNPEQALELVAKIEPVGALGELAEAVKTLGKFMTRSDEAAKLPASPARDHLLRAASVLKKGNSEAALEELISSIQVDRVYLDGYARNVCIALFRYLGETNELTTRYRRKLGMILYT